jgi:hypothetical protein
MYLIYDGSPVDFGYNFEKYSYDKYAYDKWIYEGMYLTMIVCRDSFVFFSNDKKV